MASAFPYQVAVITGASRGIGEQLALDLAEKGVKLGLLARDQEKLNELCARIRAKGGTAFGLSCDVTSRDDVLRCFSQLKKDLGFIDLMIANAGVSIYNHADRFSGEVAAQMYNVNVLGSIYAIEGVMGDMIKARKGHIVGISSIASMVSLPVASVYCASKAALSSQLSGLRIELSRWNVAVSTICPGYIRTDMTSKNRFNMPFLMEVDKASRLIIAAIVKKKREYAFPWQMSFLVRLVRILPLGLKEFVIGKFR